MKIKQKKQLNLPQLIEWGWDNKIKDEIFTCEYEAREVYFDNLSRFVSESYISNDTTFTVEVEKEITEDTVIDNLYKMDEFYEFYSTEYKTVKDVIRHSVFKVKAVYLNDDLTMTLIWRNGKLVE